MAASVFSPQEMSFRSRLRLNSASTALQRIKPLRQRAHFSPQSAVKTADWTPLCERPAQSVVQLPSFLKWRHQMTTQLQKQATTYDIPLSELQIEFRWLLEDALAVMPFYTPMDSDCAVQGQRQNQSAPWRPVEAMLFLGDSASGEASLRLSLDQLEALWVRRLKERVPIQYLINTVHWRELILTVGPGVLIPRPETEQLIDLANAALDQNPSLIHAPWVDLGTGSGALALCLARLLQQRGSNERVLAVDQSSICLSCAQKNAERLGITHRLSFLQGNWFDPLKLWKGKIGGVISNPPYVPTPLLPTLQPEVTLHEPHSALDGGPNGHVALSTLLQCAPAFLIPGGVLLLETQGRDQIQLLLQQGKAHSVRNFQNVRVHHDVYGRERFMVAIK